MQEEGQRRSKFGWLLLGWIENIGHICQALRVGADSRHGVKCIRVGQKFFFFFSEIGTNPDWQGCDVMKKSTAEKKVFLETCLLFLLPFSMHLDSLSLIRPTS